MRTFTLALLLLLTHIHGQANAYDLNYIGDTKTIHLSSDDTFTYIARDYNLGYLELISANPDIDPWMPSEGTEITLPLRHLLPDQPREGLVINLAEMRIYAFISGDLRPVTFPIGIGREGLETPVGKTHIRNKIKGPTWRPTARMREEDPTLPASVGPGKQNPLGTHALYLGWPEYLIHGTNSPFGIGRRVSSGCMRMYPESIIQLFTLIEPGTPVSIVNQPIKIQWVNDDLYLEAQTSTKQALDLEAKNSFENEPLTTEEITFIKIKAGDYADKLNWDQINTVVKKRQGIPVKILTKSKDNEENVKVVNFIITPIQKKMGLTPDLK